MSEPVLLPGNRFRLHRESATPGTFEFIAICTTLAFNRTNEMEDVTVVDDATPTAIPYRKSVKKSRSWTMNFSGIVDAKRVAYIESDFEAEGTHNYQILIDKAAADGGRTIKGAVHFESLEISKQDNGLVKFQAQVRGDGAYTTAPIA